MDNIHANPRFPLKGSPKCMTDKLVRICLHPLLNHIRVDGIDYFLHFAIFNNMFIHYSVFANGNLRAFMDHGTGFGNETTGYK